MAIIEGQVPPPPPPQGDATNSRRIVVKLRSPPPGRFAEQSVGAGNTLQDLAQSFPNTNVRPYFEEVGVPPPARLTEAAPGGSVFQSYVAVDAPADVDPVEFARTINARGDVEIAYVEGGPTPPPVGPVTPANNPLFPNQGYLTAAPNGVDAVWAWSSADGTGVGFVDVEQGWTLNHEDLVAANITLISGLNQAYPGHGTAVLGEVVGVDNRLGIIGIAPHASARVVSQYRTASNYQTGAAILSALAQMSAGDVMLLEAQTTYSTMPGYLPVEVEDAVFTAILTATEAGIIVIEAGGNGGNNLDAFRDVNGRKVLNRSSPDFRDSGAIIVGAASSAVPHGRLSFSNFGSRIDCYAWGENIQTTGDGWTGNLINSYTAGFGGTSGATPIVTGAAIVLQSWARARHQPYVPHDIRAILSDLTLNTRSANPASDLIGVMPNLKSIIQHEMQPPAVVAAATSKPTPADA